MEPLVLTLKLDEEAAHFFNALRKEHFPPERNFLQAHLTLFHHLPHEEQIVADIQELVPSLPLSFEVAEPVCIGRGVAYKIISPQLISIHTQWQRAWQQWLIPQDRQKLWPHITVQNKVAPAEAKNLQQQLAASFIPFTATGIGFQLWKYKGGPWELWREFFW